MFEITSEMRATRNVRIMALEEEIDRQIKQAAAEGLNKAYFACDYDRDSDVYAEIRAKYEAAGYTIIPTGYIGGVYQRTESICW